nr:hypothetical protein [Tanacetum cinerariifolium]
MLCRPKLYYNDLNKVDIGYKNPLCLTHAKQVQPALYNGHEIIKDNHAPAIVHNTEDTLEMADITRKKMNAKMNDPKCVTRKVKIAPHDYSKENFLATFTPQKQLNPEQIFWSIDIIKLKSKALKDQTTVAIGYKNPLCLTHAKQVQPALYNGHEIIKDNHAPTIVHNTEDTLEMAEITRKKMNAKMNDPECVTRKVKIAPYDYSKENFLATFTPQKQLTPEQIFWSNDLIKLKSKALKD